MQLKELLLVDRLKGCWAAEGQYQEWSTLWLQIYSIVQWSGVRMYL